MIGERIEIDHGWVHLRCSTRSDGSFALDEPPAQLRHRRQALLGALNARPWVAIQQVHGARVFDPVAEDWDPARTPEADAAVTFGPDHAVAVITADCAPVVLVGTTGVAVVHAGWRGAAAGVIDAAAAVLRAGGATPIATVLGPCIQPAVYEFQADDLEPIVATFGAEIAASTQAGSPALDLTRVIQLSCERSGWVVPDRPACTSGSAFYSHRVRRDVGRQATVAWIEHER